MTKRNSSNKNSKNDKSGQDALPSVDNTQENNASKENLSTEDLALQATQMTAEPEPTPQPDAKNFLEAPFAYSMAQNESVSLNNGSLTYTVTDFVLPGRNGFNLSITRRYNSDSSNTGEMSAQQPESYRFNTVSRPNWHNIKTYGLGFGWYFVLPSIEVVPVAERQPYITYTPFLHLEDGRSFAFEGNTLQDHPLADVSLTNTAGTLRHPYRAEISKSYNIVVAYKNGSSDYFQQINDESGRLNSYKLVARKDRFGNTICFTMQNYGGMVITDTWGRDIVLKKDHDTLTWTLPDSTEKQPRTIIYTSDAKRWQLLGVRDQAGRVTRYEYEEKSAVSKYASPTYGDNSNVAFTYILLKTVVHPTGAQTQYKYGLLENETEKPLRLEMKNFGGYKQFFPLRQRKDVASNMEYNIGDYAYILSADKIRVEHATVNTMNEVVEKHTFNDKNQLSHKEITHGGALVFDGDYTYGTNAAGPDYKLPVSEVTKQYDAASAAQWLEKAVRRTYTADKKANVASLIEEYPSEPFLNQQTNMLYGAYSILTEKSYQKDTSTNIKEQYTLRPSPHDKVVEFARIYENDILKQKTRYIYGNTWNDAFCVVQEQRYYTTGDEALEDAENCVLVNSVYNSGQFTHEAVETELPGIIDADGKALPPVKERYSYDACGRMVKKIDANRQITLYEYDGLGRVVRETYPETDGVCHDKAMVYNDGKNTITTKDENGNQQRVEYTPLGQVWRVFMAGQDAPHPSDVLLQSYEYDALERVIREVTHNPDGSERAATEYMYDRYDRVLTKTTPQIDYAEEHEYKDVYADPEEQGKLVARHKKTIVGGPGAPSVVMETHTGQTGSTLKEFLGGQRTATYLYDKLGNKTAHIDALGNMTQYSYDHAGRLVATHRTVGGQGQTSSTEYDALGNKTLARDWMGNITRCRYDALGRLLEQVSPFDDKRRAITKYYYDATGNLLSQKVHTGSHWRESEYQYDARGRQTQALLYEDENHRRYSQTQYIYDGAGNKLEMRTGMTRDTEDYAATRYEYDRFGNVVCLIDALGQRETYEYDATGQLVAKTDRNGSRTQFWHDAAGRLVKEEVEAQTVLGPVKSCHQTEYTRTGQKTKETAHESVNGKKGEALVSAYEYNAKGQLVRQTDPDGAEKQFWYNEAGNRARFVLRRGGTAQLDLHYTYDEVNRLQTLRSGAEGPILAHYEYDPNGNRTRLHYVQDGTQTSYAYNRANLVVRLTNRRGNVVLSCFEYEYSADGNQTAKTAQGGSKTTYVYDRLGRLVREDDPKWNRIDYEYDRFGNRSRMAVTPNGVQTAKPSLTTYEYDKNNRLLKENKLCGKTRDTWRYRYDANGNQLGREWQRVQPKTKPYAMGSVGFAKLGAKTGEVVLDMRAYNGFGRMVWAKRDGDEVRLRYRADGLRHSKSLWQNGQRQKNTVHHWDGQNMVLETDGAQAIKGLYLRGANLVAQQIDSQLFYYLFNAHGDVVQRLAEGANAAPMYHYDAFGNQQEITETDPNAFRYCGEYYDEELGEIYLRARCYDSRTGRFSAEDSIRSGENWYGYCDGNPIMLADPSGESSDPAFTPGWTDMYWKSSQKKSNTSSDPTYTPGWTDMYWNPSKPSSDPTFTPGWTDQYWGGTNQTTVPLGTDTSGIPPAFIGPPNSTIPLPGGGYRHFGPDGIADYDYHPTNHGNPKHHPEDASGGHYNDWDYSDPAHPDSGKPYIKDKDGNKIYDPKRKDNEEEGKNKNEFSWEKVGAGLVLVLLAIVIVLLILDNVTGVGFADDLAIPFIIQVMRRSYAIIR